MRDLQRANRGYQFGKKIVLCTLAAGMITVQAVGVMDLRAGSTVLAAEAEAATANAPTLVQTSSEAITSGAILNSYVWKSTRSSKAVRSIARVIQVDLLNPNVKLDVMTGKNGQLNSKNNVLNMSNESGAVAGVNGDYFDTAGAGVAMGAQMSGGQLQVSPSILTGMYSFVITNDNKPIIDTFTFQGAITAVDSATYNLTGVNLELSKTQRNADAIYLYTPIWGQQNRANDGQTTPTEVLVQNGLITQIALNTALQQAVPADGYILRTAGKAAEFVKLHLKVGDPLQMKYALQSVSNPTAYDSSTFKTIIGGHTILVDQGQAVAKFSRDTTAINGYRSRTGLGYSKDGRYAYVVTVDQGDNSDGMSLTEFQGFLVSIGAWKALNLDGGGSTQMVARPLGDWAPVLVNAPENGSMRAVANGLGVFSTAPKGQVSDFIMTGPDKLFIGQQTEFQLKAYDQYYNPVDLAGQTIGWNTADPLGTFQGNVFTAAKIGTTTVKAMIGNAVQKRTVEIIGKEQIESMRITAQGAVLAAGAVYSLPVIAVTKDGVGRTVPPQSLKWEFVGFTGTMQGDKLTIATVNNNQIGYAIARYDGFSTMIALKGAEEKLWTDFEKDLPAVAFSGLPAADTKGDARIVAGLPGAEKTKVLSLSYDFTMGNANKFAYAMIGNGGAAVEGLPQVMKIDALGDQSLNWLRAEFIDSAGKSQYADLAKRVDWTGWKTIEVDLVAMKLSYPIKLKRLYVVNMQQGQDERLPIGAVAFDNIIFRYAQAASQSAAEVKLTLGSTKVSVDGKVAVLDQAPLLQKTTNTTFVPLRFVVDAVGGVVQWNQAEKKVTILRGDQLLELWLNGKELLLNGKRVSTEIAPISMNGRTLVPLRLVSEKLGLKVGWEQKTQTITIR